MIDYPLSKINAALSPGSFPAFHCFSMQHMKGGNGHGDEATLNAVTRLVESGAQICDCVCTVTTIMLAHSHLQLGNAPPENFRNLKNY